MEHAYFAGGCFWCITPSFRHSGAAGIESGYCGGNEENPDYESVKHQKTGHRETIHLTFAEEKVSFETLLKIFLDSVDPFDGEGQFIDRGHSYTLAVYWTNEEQKRIAEEAVSKLEGSSGKKAFIELEPFKQFWKAEEYHQDYDRKNPEAFAREWKESGREARFGISLLSEEKMNV